MLAVPIIPISYENTNEPNRIIGVICCDKKETDYFTVYDRDLVEYIALSVATVIERTMALESFNQISSQMVSLLADRKNSGELLKAICNHTLKVTNAGSASIHLLEHLDADGKNYRYTGDYYTYPSGEEKPPRLTPESTTYVAIQAKKTVEFSKKNGNFNLISQEPRPHPVQCKIVVPLIITQKDNQQFLVGALYLNKYSEEQFSEVEKFAIELFASQAASIIYDWKILDENKFRANAHQDFAKAIEAITSKDDIDLLLLDVARYSYSLAQMHSRYSVNVNSEIHLVSYLLVLNSNRKIEVKAAYPVYQFVDLNNKYNLKQEKITELVIKNKEPIMINNSEEKQQKKEQGIELIQLQEETRSHLSIPIKDNQDNVIGAINIESSLDYTFNHLHQEVIEHFARQVAIAFEKKNLIDKINTSNKILNNLHESLDRIVRESPQNMLNRAVSETCEALESEMVIVIPCKKLKNHELIILKDKIVPVLKNDELIEVLHTTSLSVYQEQKDQIFPTKDVQQDEYDSKLKQLEALGFMYGLCLPFSSGINNIGVMWMLFSKPTDPQQLDKDKHIYKVYANQIALAYSNSQRFEELKKKKNEDLSKDIKIDYDNARWQATLFFLISLVTSIAGLGLIFGGVIHLLNSNSQTLLNGGGIAATLGVLLQAITVLAFERGKAANDRLD